MRAVEAKSFGGPEVLTPVELPDPVPGTGQVLVDVAAADVMFLDTLLRSGWGTAFFPVRPPYVPGGAIAGVVSAVGAGVDPAWLGTRVAAQTAASGIGGGVPTGGYAERALAVADNLLEVPAELDLVTAAALVHDGRTALALMRSAGIRPGDRVLITAAGGGVGTLLTQLVTATGAKVIAAARGEAKLALAQRLGATTVVDYSETEWTERVLAATGGEGADIVLDGAGGALGRAALEAAAPGARFLAFGSAGGGFALDAAAAAAHGVTLISLHEVTGSDIDWRAIGTEALAAVASGRLTVTVGRTFPLEKAADAHATIAARTAVGRTILTA
ncbi:zinc-binding dehydrogenase [Nocardia sp. alder85J]|uniref:zinc-binding dehydrogenase n=1 Tax=Nocardia sp. alder85J TaxID=2862949 RepID=UPI001CD38D7C|nr:zinc-binding dehydrogenase [Nocardia sp. alder85J]MCX4097652.1 zinc-binding dehydrogenase [Nocardia sp. alder85J]